MNLQLNFTWIEIGLTTNVHISALFSPLIKFYDSKNLIVINLNIWSIISYALTIFAFASIKSQKQCEKRLDV